MTGGERPRHRALVLIPSFNSGAMLLETVRDAMRFWPLVWVVVDGSTDGSDAPVRRLAADDAGLDVQVLPRNRGKGAAVLHGLRRAVAAGFTHVLVMDADGQHPAALIPAFMAASRDRPRAMVLGVPVFDASAPPERVSGRRISNWWANLETLWAGIADSLFGFRVYPAGALLSVMRSTPWMRRFDFDAEAVVRLAWRGTEVVNLAAPVRYLTPAQGGVSHFRYGRDNVLLSWMHTRLVLGAVVRLPVLLSRTLQDRRGANRDLF